MWLFINWDIITAKISDNCEINIGIRVKDVVRLTSTKSLEVIIDDKSSLVGMTAWRWYQHKGFEGNLNYYS